MDSLANLSFLKIIFITILWNSGFLLAKRSQTKFSFKQSLNMYSIGDFSEMVHCATDCNSLDFVGYGCFCGLGGSGTPVDEIDKCCEVHDNCYGLLPNCRKYFPANILDIYLNGYNFLCHPSDKEDTFCDAAEEDLCKRDLCQCDFNFVNCIKDSPCPKVKKPCPTGRRHYVQNDANCPIQSGRMYYRGVCSKLLDTCDRNENLWLIVNQRGFSNCVQRSCPRGLLLHRGRCVKPDDPVCGVSEILYVEYTGQVICDCEPNLLYDKALGQCLAEHRQGSCPDGKFLELQERQVTCVANNCPTDNMVYNPENGQCYTKRFEGLCRKPHGALKFNNMSLTASCDGVTARNIWEVPTLNPCPGGKCPPGVFKAAGIRVLTQQSSRIISCPPTHIRLPNGFCRPTNDILSG